MGLINKFSGETGEMLEESGCQCKARGTMGDYEGNPPANWTPDDPREKEMFEAGMTEGQQDEHECCGGGENCKCKPHVNKLSLTDDLTFGEMVRLMNSMCGDIKTLQDEIRRLKNG